MKRPARTGRSGSTTEDIYRDLTKDQLAAIGAVALACNEVEGVLDCLLYTLLQLPAGVWLEAVTQLGRVPNKVDLARLTISRELRLPQDVDALVEKTFTDFKLCKQYRDAIVHVRIFNSATSVGELIQSNARISEVLLDQKALDGLYERLVILRSEMRDIEAIASLISNSRKFRGAMAEHPAEVADWVSSLRTHQHERANLPVLPDFPE